MEWDKAEVPTRQWRNGPAYKIWKIFDDITESDWWWIFFLCVFVRNGENLRNNHVIPWSFAVNRCIAWNEWYWFLVCRYSTRWSAIQLCLTVWVHFDAIMWMYIERFCTILIGFLLCVVVLKNSSMRYHHILSGFVR